jgi:DnaJ family protein A protein 5
LSNPDDRAWYDSHRDQILKGKNTEEMKEEDMTYMTKGDVKKFCSSSAYKSMDPNKEKNFWTVYRDLFAQLDKEEELEEQVGTKHSDAPSFGDNLSSAEEVFGFYRQW